MKNSNPDDTKKYASTRLWKKRWYRITSFLAAVVVFCTTYALILPAVTQERTVAQDTEVSVNDITISGITDGEGPFDANDESGNDSKGDNKIVRTFDTVKYTFTVSTAGKSYDNARVKMEFILPLKKNEAEFDVAAMGWMDTTVGYKYNYQENQTRKINEIDTNCQVLTCYKHLQKTDPGTAVIPGSFTETFTVKVKAMKNRATIKPTITASLELNLAQSKEITADLVTVSAAPRYNVRLKGGPSYKGTFDFSTGNNLAQKYGDGYITEASKKNIVGRAMKFGVTLQLYNDGTPDKGFKGIELPTGSITFDLKLKSKYGSGGENDPDVTTNYTPLLWSCDNNSWTDQDKANSDGRTFQDISGCAYEYAPRSSGPGVWYGDDKTCYHGGGWSAKQTGDTIFVTVSDYAIDVNQMPTKNGDGGSVLYNPANGEGCFSSGEIWIVQPFNKKSSTTNSGYDIQKEYQNGTFYTTVEVQNLKSTSIGGTAFNDPTDTNNAQMNKEDDKEILTLPLYSEGKLTNRIAYRKDATSDEGVGVNDPYDGKDFATPGTNLYIYSGIDYTDNGEPDNQLYWATNFTRINADIFEVTDEPIMTCKADGSTVDPDNYKVLYVGNDTNWRYEWDLQAGTEDWRTYYTSLDLLKNDKKKCIGVLYCVKGPLSGSVSFSARLPVKVREDLTKDQIGKAYMTVSTSRAWTKKMYENDGKSESDIPALDIWTDRNTLLDSSFPRDPYQHANIQNGDWDWYKKEIYPEDGYRSTPHNSEWNWFGDTLLVIKFKSQINKTLLQKLPDGSVKDTFNLDANQRYVDFMLQPTIEYDNKQGSNMNDVTTLTIVDTLPKGLKYVAGSAYIGGTYKQTSVNGGTKGTVTGGRSITLSSGETPTEPINVGDATLFIKEEADGTTTLTWKVKCKIGEPVKPIYYSVEIGDRYNASKDIDVGTTQLPYNVRIYAAGEDLREPTAANGNYVKNSISATRGNAYSFGKYTTNETVEPNGNINYKIYYDNISTGETPVKLVDVMPADGINGSQFSGNYTVQSFKFDTTKCEVTKLRVYYTENKAYQSNDIVDESVIRTNWNPAGIDDYSGAVTEMNGITPVAFAVLGTLDAEKSVNIDLTIKLNDPSTPKFTYVDFDSEAVKNYYKSDANNNGANVVPSDEAHGYSIKFTEVKWKDVSNPNAIAVSNLAGTGRFTVEKGKKYKVSLDYHFVDHDYPLQVLAIVDNADTNAKNLNSPASYDLDPYPSQRGYLWSNISEGWKNFTFQSVDSSTLYFVAPKDGNVFIIPIDMAGTQEIWFDNIKIEEIQENKYVNAVIIGANSTTQQTTATTPIIRRSIEGLTWLDRNSDGVQNDGPERCISHVNVSLLKLKDGSDPTNEANYETYHYPGTNSPVTVETGKQVSVISQGAPADYTDYIPGRYRFMDLPEGTYAVKFEDGTGDIKISPLIASPANRGEDVTLDSDGIAVYKEDRSELLRTYILNIKIPAAAVGYTYESKCNDSGFYERGYELPKSGGKGTDAYTFLGLTIWGFAFLAFVYRKARKTFGKSK